MNSASCIRGILLGLLVSLIVSIIILSCVPPVSKDALIHHLAIPKLYLKHGGVYEIPFMVFSYYPMNLDLIYMIPLYFGNDIVPKFIHFVFALLTAWLIFDYLKRRINTLYALLGVIFFLSVPIIVKLSITAYVDLGLIFFSTASLLLLLKWLENGFQFKLLVFSAIFCGLAMGTKYNGLITFALLTFFVPFIYSRYADHTDSNSYRAAKYGIVFAGIALLVFSPWMIRNYIWTNNPIFPLYDHWFNPQYGEAQTSAGPFTYRALIYHESWWQIALLPVRIFFQGQDGSPQYFDGKLNPFLPFLPLFAFYQLKKDSQSHGIEKKILLAFACLFLAFAFFSSDLRIRYISPIIAPLVILSVLGIKKIIDIVGDLKKQTAKQIGVFLPLSALTFSLAYNADYLFDQFVYVEPLSYLKGNVSRDEYISKYRPEFPAFQYINEHLPNNALILFIFLGNRGYYCERSYIFDMYENKSKLQQIVENAHDTEGIVSSLQDMGITHLFIHSDIFKRWVKMNFTERTQGLLENFLSMHVKKVYAQWEYDLYALEDLPSS